VCSHSLRLSRSGVTSFLRVETWFMGTVPTYRVTKMQRQKRHDDQKQRVVGAGQHLIPARANTAHGRSGRRSRFKDGWGLEFWLQS
jgi:hypothetical protein